jgi:hypothetical protein
MREKSPEVGKSESPEDKRVKDIIKLTHKEQS